MTKDSDCTTGDGPTRTKGWSSDGRATTDLQPSPEGRSRREVDQRASHHTRIRTKAPSHNGRAAHSPLSRVEPERDVDRKRGNRPHNHRTRRTFTFDSSSARAHPHMRYRARSGGAGHAFSGCAPNHLRSELSPESIPIVMRFRAQTGGIRHATTGRATHSHLTRVNPRNHPNMGVGLEAGEYGLPPIHL